MRDCQIIRKNETHLKPWSGGTTRELFIYPSESSYAKRDFLFRLSIATIEVDASDFTPLEGVKRTTLILDGSIELHHEGHYSKQLNRFESDSYDGGWKSRSEGQCKDFNLMMRENTTGQVQTKSIAKGEDYSVLPSETIQFMYVYSGRIQLSDGKKLDPEDLLIISRNSESMELLAVQPAEVVLGSVEL